MEASIGIKQKFVSKVTEDLSRLLADEFVLYVKTRNAHWNVEGQDFHAAHKFFEEQYEFLELAIDDVAERIRSLGHYAPATLKEYLKLTHLTEQSREKNSSLGFIKDLLADHEAIIIQLRSRIDVFVAKYKDAGSSDFITGLMERHEKIAWMLRAHLAR